MWLACHTQEEIAQAVDGTQKKISDLSIGLAKSATFPNPLKVSLSHLHFEPMSAL
jgi:hypothetical protein